MITYEFEGWVHRVNRQSWGTEVVVRADADESAVKFKQHMLFFASRKYADRVPQDLDVNDKVKVKFIPILEEGVSEKTKRAYSINKMMIMELSVEEKIAPQGSGDEQSGGEELPF